MSNAFSKVVQNGKTVIIEDYTNCNKEEMLRRVEEVIAWAGKQPPGSLLTLTDVTDQHFDNESIEAFKKLASHNKPYTKAGAIVGITGLLKIAYTTVMAFSGRKMPVFKTRQEAIDWLVQQ